MQTGLILSVPDLPKALAMWRHLALPGTRLDVPGHLTVLYPWVDREPTEGDRARVRGATRHQRPFPLTFGEVGSFPGFVWLRPEPAGTVCAVYAALMGAFAEFPPYAGQYAEVIPHLTVATCEPAETSGLAARAAAALSDPGMPGLGPFHARGIDVAMRRSETDPFTVRRLATFGAAPGRGEDGA